MSGDSRIPRSKETSSTHAASSVNSSSSATNPSSSGGVLAGLQKIVGYALLFTFSPIVTVKGAIHNYQEKNALKKQLMTLIGDTMKDNGVINPYLLREIEAELPSNTRELRTLNQKLTDTSTERQSFQEICKRIGKIESPSNAEYRLIKQCIENILASKEIVMPENKNPPKNVKKKSRNNSNRL